MPSADVTDLCRLTVLGPDRKVDLAVPSDTTVATLLPILLGHTGDESHLTESGDVQGSWVLQRLGGPPLDPDGTPGSLDLLEGEELYLRPAENPLPELDFDDLADGIATAVNRQRDRWNPEFGYRLFLTLAAAVTGLIVTILLQDSPALARSAGAGALALAFGLGTALAGKHLRDRVITTLAGVASCGLAALAGLSAATDAGRRGVELTPLSLSAALAAAAATALLLIALHWLLADQIPVAPFTGLLVISAVSIAMLWIHVGAGYTLSQTAGLTGAFLMGVVVFAPRMVIQAARLRGPQLPRTAEELQQDIEPVPAEEVLIKGALADRYLSVVFIGVSLAYAGVFQYLASDRSWGGTALAIVYSAALLLRARNLYGAWQRVSVTVAGTWGAVLVLMTVSRTANPEFRILIVAGLLLLLAVLVTAALRPPTRRMLPIWGHLANGLDTAAGLAAIPLLLQLLGVYAWARGLAG
jgi:type VII secretion integral membrane protein EccD